MSAKIVITGGRGRLGSILTELLTSQGHKVSSPSRDEVDWSDMSQAYNATFAQDIVFALAAWTDVVGAQSNVAKCVRDTVRTAVITSTASALNRCRVIYISSDYVMPLLRAQEGSGVYSACKLVAEQMVLEESYMNTVARVAFVTEEQASNWGWVDGISKSCRLWVDEAALEISKLAIGGHPRIVHIGNEEVTLENMLRSRFPEHPALDNVITCEEELKRLGKNLRPKSTVWRTF